MNLNLKKISLKEIIYINKYKNFNIVQCEFIQILEKKKNFHFQPLPFLSGLNFNKIGYQWFFNYEILIMIHLKKFQLIIKFLIKLLKFYVIVNVK